MMYLIFSMTLSLEKIIVVLDNTGIPITLMLYFNDTNRNRTN
ncbi:hypothetical protein [uncultured Kordia sp.]|nr:hypothetical protein [uncultured Kordia sp.]